MNNGIGSEDKSIHRGLFIGMCVIAWFVGALLINSLSIAMANIYAYASFAAFIGFWSAKVVLKSIQRNWKIIFGLPIIFFISAVTGYAFGIETTAGTLVTTIVSFLLSSGLFSLLDKNKSK